MRDRRLQFANQNMLEKYCMWATHMLTLTLLEKKEGVRIIKDGWAKGSINAWESEISVNAAKTSVRHFIAALNYKLYKRKTRRAGTKNCCRILAIPVLEGEKSSKRMHIHILLGNLPEDKLGNIEQVIDEVWAKTKWGMHRKRFDKIYDADGLAFYLAKETGFCNNEAVCWELASVPDRLLGVWA